MSPRILRRKSNASTTVEQKPCASTKTNACSTVEERRLSAASSIPNDKGFSPRGRTPTKIVIPTEAFRSRRERNAQWRDLLLLATALTALALPAQTQKPPTADLPAGPMQSKATTACLECHEARIILQQRLTKGAWTKEVDKMMKWGAVVDPADRDPIIDYLSTNFNPDKPPYDPQRTSASGKSSK
jgi:hypothetical protein